MKNLPTSRATCALALFFALAVLPRLALHGDVLITSSGRSVTGTVLQRNANNILLLKDYCTLNYRPSEVQEIRIEKPEAVEAAATNRLLYFKPLLLLLGAQPWASNLKQIPATVIDRGLFQKVPYVSFRCGEDYEVNIYGDLDQPAGVEAGVYRNLLGDASAKSNCLNLLCTALHREADKETLRGLNLEKDLKTLDGLTFEVTPPFAEDAYMGWWISVYSTEALNSARASDKELRQITAEKPGPSQDQNPSAWSADELKLARRSPPTVITFTNAQGVVMSNLQVRPYIEGVSLIWRDGTAGGIIRLADLPEDLRAQFGYDAAKTEAANAAAKERAAAEWRDAQAAAAQFASQVKPSEVQLSASGQNRPVESE